MPRINASTVEQHREELHGRIFAAFTSLMAERSFDAISMAQIAARAGVGRTAIYHHFADKEAVVVAFATHETSRYVAALEQVLAAAGSPPEALRVYVRHHLASGEEFHLGLGPQVYGVLSAESRSAIREHVSAVESVLRGILRAGAASGAFAIDDEDGVTSLIHACLNPRHLAPATVEDFVLRAVTRPDRPTGETR